LFGILEAAPMCMFGLMSQITLLLSLTLKAKFQRNIIGTFPGFNCNNSGGIEMPGIVTK
jgi:hypothetical protein